MGDLVIFIDYQINSIPYTTSMDLYIQYSKMSINNVLCTLNLNFLLTLLKPVWKDINFLGALKLLILTIYEHTTLYSPVSTAQHTLNLL